MSDRVPWEGAPRPPRAWQAEALPLVMQAIRDNRKGIVGVVTGGGKSILQAELVHLAVPKAERLGRCVVVVAPRQALVRQLSRTIGERVGHELVGCYFSRVKEADRLVVVCCAASLGRLEGVLAEAGRRCSLLIVDECHSSEARDLQAAIAAIDPLRVVGFTATPYRSDKRESLGLFDEVVYRYGYDEALRDGVLVPFVPINWDGEGEPDTDRVVVDMIKAHGHGPGIVSALDIEDAEAHAVYLTANGIPARAIHSKQDEEERAVLLERLRVGELRALVHVALLAEGVDLPWLRWLALRRPTKARVRFVQELGRVLRVVSHHEPWAADDLARWGEKRHAMILDPHDALGALGLKHPDQLGKVAQIVEEEERRNEKAEREAQIRAIPGPVAVHELQAFAQLVLAELAKKGLAFKPDRPPATAAWPPTPRQLEYLRTLKPLTRMMPEHVREPFKSMIDGAERLGYNAVADMIETLRGVQRYTADARRANRYVHLPRAVINAIPEVSQLTLAAFGRGT